jgi:glycosyltransferase involved in cell wall biosynthesis/SAM-dependent methyltransferase
VHVKVVHVITKLPIGGATESVLALCRWIDRSDAEQVIVTGPDLDTEGTLLPLARRLARVEIVSSLVRRPSPAGDPRAIADLVRLLRRERPDVVHTHSSKAGVVGRIAAHLAGVPVVHGVHGWSFHDEMTARGRQAAIEIERRLARWTDRIVVEGTPDVSKGLDAGIGRPEQYVLIRNGIDVDAIASLRSERAAIRAELGFDASTPVVGSLGGLRPQKDPVGLIAAFAEVRGAVPHARLVMVGDGPLRAEVERAVDALGQVGAVTLVGARKDALRWYGAFDVFAMASLWEGLPRTATEAMAAGTPVVATTVDGLSELITDGVHGRLVTPHDRHALAAAISEVLLSPDTAQRFATAARARVRTFDVRAMAAETMALYRELAPRAARTATETALGPVPEPLLSDDQLAHFDTDYVSPATWAVIETMVGGVKGDRCIDLGGGTGRFADKLLAADADEVVVLDDAQVLLDRSVPHPAKRLVRASIFDADVVDGDRYVGWADLVSINLVLHHLVDPSSAVCDLNAVAALEVAKRLLAPGGRVLVLENAYDGIGGNDLPGRIVHAMTSSPALAGVTRRLGANTAGVGVRFRSTRRWTQIFDAAGYDVIDDRTGDRIELGSAQRRGLGVSSAHNHLFLLRPR